MFFSKKKLCSQNISRISCFVYMSEKNTPFPKVFDHFPFLDIYFCPFSLFQSTFGFSKLCKLYILWILILKEINKKVLYTFLFIFIGYFLDFYLLFIIYFLFLFRYFYTRIVLLARYSLSITYNLYISGNGLK